MQYEPFDEPPVALHIYILLFTQYHAQYQIMKEAE